jgi:hypothetical protein
VIGKLGEVSKMMTTSPESAFVGDWKVHNNFWEMIFIGTFFLYFFF